MKSEYHIISKGDSRELAKRLSKESGFIEPLVDLLEKSRIAVDEMFDYLGRMTLETVLLISASNVAGEPHQGRKGGNIIRHGVQEGVVSLGDRKIRVQKPRLRERVEDGGREVAIPAYEAMQSDESLGSHILSTMMKGVSTRNYEDFLPESCERFGVSKSSVSREFVERSEAECKRLLERRFDDLDILVIYVDGMIYADHSVIVAVGVEGNGCKHVLGVMEGATENAVVAKALLESLVERGVSTGVRRLFVIDGSKALRAAIDAVFGEGNPVQRCRNHKIRNVKGYLPIDMGEYAAISMKAAFKLDANLGIKKLRELAESFSKQYPDAASSLLEGLEEMFTINSLGVSGGLRRSLGSTNIIESAIGCVKRRTGRVSRWRDGSMVKRWVASSLLDAEKRFRRIFGYNDLWMLEAALRDSVDITEKRA